MMQSNTILYAEDDENFALLLKSTLKQGGFTHDLQHVPDGAEAMAYLKGEGKYHDRAKHPFPCVVLADLKMPRVSGLDLVAWIRKESHYAHLPVVILTCADEHREIQKAYAGGANSYLVKPPQVDDLKAMVKMLDGFWVQYNRTVSEGSRKELWKVQPENVIQMTEGDERRSA